MYLVDTNVLSELARPSPDRHALAWFARARTLAVSVVSLEELSFGISRLRGARRGRLAHWLESLEASVSEILDVTPAIARASGDLRATRTRAGRPVAQADMLIAATALVHGLTLATRNVSDFVGCGVSIEDPFAP